MGTIVSTFSDLLVGPYAAAGNQNAWFQDQIQIAGDAAGPFDESFAQRGDSGSLVVAFETGEPPAPPFSPVVRGTDPVGLYFAGDGPFGWANPLDAVLDELRIPQL
jgi:hypothetical protein